jgi:hypothetical protein
MALVLNGPQWFRVYESLFVFIAGFITILIALLSYKAYTFTKEAKYKYFSTSFFLLGISFFVLSIFSSILITHLSSSLDTFLVQFDYAFLIHMLLAFVAYMVLLILTLKVKSKTTMALLMSLVFLFALFSYQYYLKFHLVSLVLLFFLSVQYYNNYMEKKLGNARLVFISFYLLACAEVFLILFMYTTEIFYVVGRVLQFIGYLILFYTFLRVANHNGTKKREIRHN